MTKGRYIRHQPLLDCDDVVHAYTAYAIGARNNQTTCGVALIEGVPVERPVTCMVCVYQIHAYKTRKM